ncbi:MAG: 30S ribosomal protein S6 [Christensenellales bacterium]
MNKYEILYILDNDLTDEMKSKLVDKFVQVIEQLNGKIVLLDKWGTRKFAYEINKKNEGFYFLMNVEADATVPLEIERQVSITEGAVRCMILKKDEFPVIKKTRKVDKPKKDEDKSVKKEEPVESEPAAADAAVEEPKPVEVKPVEVKPVEVKPVEVKPVEDAPQADTEDTNNK